MIQGKPLYRNVDLVHAADHQHFFLTAEASRQQAGIEQDLLPARVDAENEIAEFVGAIAVARE